MGANYPRPVNKQARAEQCSDLQEKVVNIARVAKVVKGGRRFSFSALAVIGDEYGHVGYGLGKANEVPDAISKATQMARKRLIKVPLVGTTIPFEVEGRFGSSRVKMMPASPGTGVIAGSVVRNVLERVGVKDILTKCYGSRNPHNLLAATFDGLLKLESPEETVFARGKKLEDVGYQPFGNQ